MNGVPILQYGVHRSLLTWCDTVGIESLLLWELFSLLLRLGLLLPGVFGSSESSRSLLVHLCPGGDTVNGHEEDLLRLDLCEQVIDIGEYRQYHLFFRYTKVHVVLGRCGVGTIVDDTVLQVSSVHLPTPLTMSKL